MAFVGLGLDTFDLVGTGFGSKSISLLLEFESVSEELLYENN